MARVQNRGKIQRGPFVLRHSLAPVKAPGVHRANKRPGTLPEVKNKRLPSAVTFGAAGSPEAIQTIHTSDLVSGPLARALKDPRDGLTLVKGDN